MAPPIYRFKRMGWREMGEALVPKLGDGVRSNPCALRYPMPCPCGHKGRTPLGRSTGKEAIPPSKPLGDPNAKPEGDPLPFILCTSSRCMKKRVSQGKGKPCPSPILFPILPHCLALVGTRGYPLREKSSTNHKGWWQPIPLLDN
jgi:hypothetical protein